MDNRGITIIELILILAIMGIIVSIAVPQFDFSDSEMKRYGRELVMDLNYIKTKSKTAKVNKYNKISLSKDLNGKYYYNLKIDNKFNKKVYLEEKFKITTNLSGQEIYFTRMGIPTPAGTIRIINNENNNYIEITITPATGRIHMYEDVIEGYNENLKYEVGTN